MGFLDNLRDRLRGDVDDYDDDYYDDYDDYDDDYDDEPTGSGLLGNTPRPEAESVAVYTRSGRPVPSNNDTTSSRSQGSSDSYSSYRSRRSSTRDSYEEDDYDSYESPHQYTPTRSTMNYNMSGQLPPYVLRAESYEDVQAVVRRVRTNQTVLLDLVNTDPDVAQRILDFCFGLSFGIDGEVTSVGNRAFAVLPAGMQISQAEADRLLAGEH